MSRSYRVRDRYGVIVSGLSSMSAADSALLELIRRREETSGLYVESYRSAMDEDEDESDGLRVGDLPTVIDDVIVALENVAEVHADSDDRGHITDYAPDSSEPEYDGNTEPGSAWDEACAKLLSAVRSALPAGWEADWSDNDVVITRTRRV